MPQVEIWIGNNRISEAGPNANASASASASASSPGAGSIINSAADKLKAIGPSIASIFSAMDIPQSVLSDKVGAEEFELEVGFSIEVGPGGALQLLLSPKAGMSYKAKAKWKRSDEKQNG
jgi:hypothetical protein